MFVWSNILFNSQIAQLKLPLLQDIQLTGEHLKGEKELLLKFVKFQDIQNIQLFVKDNQVGCLSLAS